MGQSQSTYTPSQHQLKTRHLLMRQIDDSCIQLKLTLTDIKCGYSLGRVLEINKPIENRRGDIEPPLMHLTTGRIYPAKTKAKKKDKLKVSVPRSPSGSDEAEICFNLP